MNTSEGVAGGCYFLRSPSVFLFYFCAHHPVLTIVDVAEEGKEGLGQHPMAPVPTQERQERGEKENRRLHPKQKWSQDVHMTVPLLSHPLNSLRSHLPWYTQSLGLGCFVC